MNKTKEIKIKTNDIPAYYTKNKTVYIKYEISFLIIENPFSLFFTQEQFCKLFYQFKAKTA